ncbi:MAG: leucine-rich repeat protein [Clostridiales bacterium]|nr:leucine-rich repeat protein [Clostridiales bacterium]
MERKLLWTSLLACLLLALLCCAAESGDFTIDENGVLTKYTGSDAVVTVPDGVTAIGKEAFYAKSAITEIHLPTGITSIGDSAFRSCTGLTELHLPTGITSIGANAFRSCTGLTEIVVPDSVETIGDNAFYDCSGLTSLRLSQGLKTLGTNVFLSCNSLTEVEIPAGVESVGNYIASNTLRLRCAVGSSAAKALSKAQNDFWVEDFQLRYAFDSDGSAASLTLKKYAGDAASVTIPDGVTIVGDSAFNGNTSLTAVVLPDSVVTIGANAFQSCTGLTKAELSSKLEKIANYAFNNCKALKEIQIPETVTEIGIGAFQYCAGLTELTLPEGLQTIGESAFVGCSGLTRLAIPDGVQSVGINAFHSINAQLCCSMGSRAAEALSRVGYDFYTETWKLRYTFDSDKQVNGLRAERYLGSDAAVTLPEGTTLIGGSAFKDCAFITSVTLPEKLLSIGNYAFSGCMGLTEIVIPDSVTTIGSYAFSGCTGLTRVVLPAGLTAIPDWCFNNCEKLPGIAIPETVTSIGSWAFCYCSELTAITLPQGLQTLGANAFLYCENLPYVDVPDTLESAGYCIASDTTQLRCSIGSSAAYALSKKNNSFYNNGYRLCYTYADRDGSVTGLVLFKYVGTEAEVRVPDGVTELLYLSFCSNSAVTSVILPETVVKIGEKAFSECKNLTSVTIPQGIVEIQSYAFLMSPKLTVIDIPDGLQKAARLAEDNVQFRCSFGSSAAFALSKGGNSFCAGDFQMRYLFDDEGNRNGLRLNKYLGTDAEVTVPEEVTETGSAFKDCKTVTKVVLPAGLTKLESDIFSGCTALKEIAIPEGVTSIGNGAFRDCEALTELALPQGLKKIESYVFIGCTGLSYIDIPDGVETIDGHIVNEPTQLRCTLGSSAAIALSKSDNGFCVDGFRLCYGFDDDGNTNGLTVKRYVGSETEVTVPDGVDSIGDSAFHRCTGLSNIVIPDSVVSIGDSAFYGCTGLTKLALPQGLKEIGVNAFLGCEGLSYIDIPDGVETVGDWIASESTQLRCSLGSSAAIAISKAEQNFCVDDFAVRHSFTDGGAVNGLIAERYVGGKVGAVLTLPQGVTETSQYLLNEEPLENVMCLKLPEGFKKLTIDNLLWRSAVVFPESIQSIAIEEEWEGAPPVIFYCYRDTVAESFAQKRGITIVYLDGFKPAQTTVAMRSDYTLPIGSELRLSEIAAAVPSMPENCALNAVSSNPEVLQVESDGTIRVVGKGDATLRVSLSRYPDIYAEACVWGYVQPTSATLAEEIWIPAKATRDLLKKDLIILPADNRAPIGYGMDNWEMFEQLEGEFTLMAVNRGDTALYVEVPGFDTLTAQIHVTARFSELAFEQTALTIPADTRATLRAQAVTTTHTYVNEYMTFESSAPDVATVDEDGVVYGVSEGSATITATSYNGLTAVCTVTVQGGNSSRLKLPAFLKEIGEEAFAGCCEESVIVPDGCETIGARAFADSANLRTITIPASVTSIAADAFDGCTDLTIRTSKGSYASRYAAAHGFGCVAE